MGEAMFNGQVVHTVILVFVSLIFHLPMTVMQWPVTPFFLNIMVRVLR